MRCISFASITIAPTVQNSQNHTYKISSEKAGKLHSLFNSLIWMCYLTHRHMLVFTVFRRHLLWFLLKFWAQGKKKKKKPTTEKKCPEVLFSQISTLKHSSMCGWIYWYLCVWDQLIHPTIKVIFCSNHIIKILIISFPSNFHCLLW